MRWWFGPCLLICWFPCVLWAADWNAFRGPAGDGVSSETKAPTIWSATDNIAWKIGLPQPGNSSPIVAQGRVFLTCAEDKDGKQRSLYCFDRQTGKTLWVKTVAIDEVLPTHETNPYCGSSPAASDDRVVAFHGSAGLYCYDLDGQEVWSKKLGELRHEWGYGASPISHENRVILHFCPGAREFIAAFDIATGKELWRTDEPAGGAEGARTDEAYVGSWSTPIIAAIDGNEQILCSTTTRVNGYDPASGKLLWWCRGLRGKRGDLSYSSPIVSGDLCVTTGGFQGPAIGFRMGGMGYITEQRLWQVEPNPQSIGTGVIVGKHLYRPNAGPGTIECIEVETGRIAWTERAGGGNHWGSILSVGGLLYATNQDGQTTIFRPDSAKFEEVAVNRLEEHTNSTPAISDGQIFIRTFNHLFCVGIQSPTP